MSTMKRLGWVCLLGALSSVACQKKETPTEESVPAATVEAAKSQTAPEQKLDEEIEALAALIDMPEDYLGTAEEEINDDNLAAELDKLEKELVEEEKANPQLVLPTPPSAKASATAKPAVAKPTAPKPAAPKP